MPRVAGNGAAKDPMLRLVARLDGLEDRIMQRFDRADEDRRDMADRVALLEGKLWKAVLGVGVVALGEILHLALK